MWAIWSVTRTFYLTLLLAIYYIWYHIWHLPNISIFIMFSRRTFKTIRKYIVIFLRFMNDLLIWIIHSIVPFYLWEVFDSVHFSKFSNKYWISFRKLFHPKSINFIKYCISLRSLGWNNISKKATVKILKTTFLGYS